MSGRNVRSESLLLIGTSLDHLEMVLTAQNAVPDSITTTSFRPADFRPDFFSQRIPEAGIVKMLPLLLCKRLQPFLILRFRQSRKMPRISSSLAGSPTPWNVFASTQHTIQESGD